MSNNGVSQNQQLSLAAGPFFFLLCILAKRIRDPGFVSPERFLAIESKESDFLLFLNLVSETPYVALMQAAISFEKLYLVYI